jgi:hypothetical protein
MTRNLDEYDRAKTRAELRAEFVRTPPEVTE